VQLDHVVVAADVGVADEDLRHAGAAGAFHHEGARRRVTVDPDLVQSIPLLLRKFLAATQ
jgi:hypothetical protein